MNQYPNDLLQSTINSIMSKGGEERDKLREMLTETILAHFEILEDPDADFDEYRLNGLSQKYRDRATKNRNKHFTSLITVLVLNGFSVSKLQ
jgi:hypothetical protein